ncbi:helix-turn-helix transcriptional regulator [Roseovarius sp. A46]|uniref:helix-turn-helix domain-containing protein n=1 Tax=Roseovarius sp. A46 TaxID=2109331 RepID=UPI0013E96371|nr:helix-turn-helix transcriptional regulator [Roseovarius sp. A46]
MRAATARLQALVHSIFMQDFSQSLIDARRKSGLSQADCAHLLGVSQSHVSRLELGHAAPSVPDLCGVAIIFGRTMELLVEPLFRDRARLIRQRLFDLPEPRSGWLGRFVRNNALHNLEVRVERIIDHYGC